MNASAPARTVLFGAFDRHNLGDWLFPHLLAALLPDQRLRFAGLAARDFTPLGGHAVQPLAAQGAVLWHAGGETLDCSAWQAAVMLQPPEGLAALLAHLERHADERAAWIATQVHGRSEAPYVAGRESGARRLLHVAVGGVGLAQCSAAHQAAVVQRLREADAVTVRDRVTQAWLRGHGIDAPLLPDAAVTLPGPFAATIEAHAQAWRERWPGGWLAVQCSAEFGDDATLDALAHALRPALAGLGVPAVLFRAGAAPWHDDLAVLQRLAMRLPGAAVVETLPLWPLVALVAAGRGFVGSSLHGRLVALAHGLPAVSLAPPQTGAAKLQAWMDTWEPGERAAAVADAGEALHAALAVPAAARRQLAAALAARFREGFAALSARAG